MVKILKGHTSPVEPIAILLNGFLASGSFDGTIRIWDLESGQTIKTLANNCNPPYCIIQSLAVLQDGSLAIGSYKEIRIWNMDF